jgi:hypothetical protein|tara:strand:+ start:352 stop:534 length:183 start_codon:yes stop_codon:yes gene_type:complete
MNAGDLIRCGKEIGIVLDTQARPPGLFHGETVVWLDILWEDGDIEGISPEDVDEVINESR